MLNDLPDSTIEHLNTLKTLIENKEKNIKQELTELDALYEQVTNLIRNDMPVGKSVKTKEYKGSEKMLIDAVIVSHGKIQHKLNRIVHPTTVTTPYNTEKPYSPHIIFDEDYWDVEVGNVRKYLSNIEKEHQKRRSYAREKDSYYAENIV